MSDQQGRRRTIRGRDHPLGTSTSKSLSMLITLANKLMVSQGQRVENQQAFTFDVKHTFSTNRKVLVCAEQLWMSNKTHPDHYRKTHAENEGQYMSNKTSFSLLSRRGCTGRHSRDQRNWSKRPRSPSTTGAV